MIIGLVASAMVMIGLGQGPADASHSTVTAVKGSAYGYHAFGISLFGSAQADKGPAPSVALAADASNSPQSASIPAGNQVVYGPAFLFTSAGPLTATTSGSLGGTGGVTSSAVANDINSSRVEILGEDNYDCCVLAGTIDAGSAYQREQGTTLVPPQPMRPLTDIASTCTATTTATTGSTTITNGWLYLDSGWYDGDVLYPEPAVMANGLAEHDPVKIPLPSSPAVNLAYSGHIHLSPTSTDYYVVAFNEQTTSADGTLTVNAVHQYFGMKLQADPAGAYVGADGSRYKLVKDAAYSAGGSVLHGDLILGRSVCDVTTSLVSH